MSAAGGDAPKRPPKSTANPKGASSTKRGRPRVEPQDESATERRRTQIRLAQRAYRERKETTIAALERRVAQLQQTVEDMNQTLLNLNDEVLASGATAFKPALGEALRRTTEYFAELTRTASAGDDGDGKADDAMGGPARGTKRRRSEIDPNATATTTLPDPAEPLPGPPELHPGLDELQTAPPLMQPPDFGYTVPYGTGSLLGSFSDPYSPTRTTHAHSEPAWMPTFPPDPPPPPPPPLPHPPETDPGAHQGQQTQAPEQPLELQPHPPGPAPPLDVPRYTPTWMATIDPVPTLKLPRTHSHHEPAFWRRLQRESHERVLMLLTDPRAPPELWQAKMRYSLCFGNARTIADAVRAILAKSARDGAMGNWDWPFMHVGGSGLHFDPPAGESAPPPAGWRAERNVGPWCPTHMRAHTAVPAADFPWNVPRLTGMDCEFFDCHDVEMYLRGKGLYLTATSSVAEMEVDEPVAADGGAADEGVTGRAAAAAAAPSTATGTAGIAAATAAAGAPPPVLTQQPPLTISDNVSLESTSSPDTPPVPVVESGSGVDVFSVSCGLDGYAPAPIALALHSNKPIMPNGTAPMLNGLPISVSSAPSRGLTPVSPPAATTGGPPDSRARGKRRVTVNVDRLLDLLNCMAVCLGRSPGYRREDVDSALELVLQEAWVK